jgi:hypothetical protein
LLAERTRGRFGSWKNKRPRKVSQALVKLDQAEAEVRTILADGRSTMTTQQMEKRCGLSLMTT